MELTAILIQTENTLYDLFSGNRPTCDYLYVVPKDGAHPSSSWNSKIALFINFSSNKNPENVLEEIANLGIGILGSCTSQLGCGDAIKYRLEIPSLLSNLAIDEVKTYFGK
jgi:hypothetical protein